MMWCARAKAEREKEKNALFPISRSGPFLPQFVRGMRGGESSSKIEKRNCLLLSVYLFILVLLVGDTCSYEGSKHRSRTYKETIRRYCEHLRSKQMSSSFLLLTGRKGLPSPPKFSPTLFLSSCTKYSVEDIHLLRIKRTPEIIRNYALSVTCTVLSWFLQLVSLTFSSLSHVVHFG